MRFAITFLALLLSCNSTSYLQLPSIKWTQVDKAEKRVDFCQLDSVGKEIILSFSHPYTIGGGYQVKLMGKQYTLLSSNSRIIDWLFSTDTCIWISETNFESNTLKTNLLKKGTTTNSLDTINNPLEGLRKVLVIKNKIVIEGNLEGTGHIYYSSINDISWKEINSLQQGFKSVELVGVFKDDLLAIGSKKFNYQDNYLLKIDLETGRFRNLIDIDESSIIRPVSIRKDLILAVNGSAAKVYSVNDVKAELNDKFKLPNGITDIKNFYLSDTYYILTAKEDKSLGRTLSWITLDKGKNWHPLEHEHEYQLLYNPIGQIFMVDKNNNIMSANQ